MKTQNTMSAEKLAEARKHAAECGLPLEEFLLVWDETDGPYRTQAQDPSGVGGGRVSVPLMFHEVAGRQDA